MTELPTGWATATVEELAAREPASITDGPFGSALKRSHYTETGARVVRLGNLGDGKFIDDDKAYVPIDHFETLQRHKVLPGDILVAALGDPLGRACRAPDYLGPAIVKADCFRVRPHEAVSASLLVHWLNSPQIKEDMAGSSHGLGRVRINLSDLKSLSIPLPPQPEQRRIVAKLDSLRARSARARHELDHIPKLIERYKQAILAKAFSGDLTADWRTTNSHVAWSQADSQQIRERHEAYLTARRGSRLRELAVSDQAEVLPSTWLHGNLADVVDLLAGFAFKSSWYQKAGVRLLRGANIAPGALDWSDEVRVSEEQAADFDDHRLAAGDIVVAMDRPMISGGFKIARVPEADDGALLVQRVSRIRPIRQLDPAYAWHFLNSQIFIGHAMSTATGSDLPHISANDILSAPIHLPPPPEQREIARRLASALAWLDKIAAEHERAVHLLPKLDQAILAKAFRGKLVPQRPNDEPASALLERIKAERERGEQPTRRRARSA